MLSWKFPKIKYFVLLKVRHRIGHKVPVSADSECLDFVIFCSIS